jgi:hypothetical protein
MPADPDVVLQVDDLRRACSLLLDAAQNRLGAEINLTERAVDLYWNVDIRAAYDMVQAPEQHLDCGQSTDDLAEIKVLLERDTADTVALWHGLAHAAGLLRLLAYLDLPTNDHSTHRD